FQPQFSNRHEQLSVGVCFALPEIEVAHGAERLKMMFAGLTLRAVTIETLRHEMSSVIFLQKPAWRHFNSRGARHERVGIFDAAVIGASSQFHIRAYPIELHKP